MRYCKKCTMPDTRPGITFDSEGVCSACRHYENRKNVDWDARFKEFEAYCNKYRGMNGPGGYDCAVAVSGGKDSHFQVWMLKEVMHMNPILFSVEDNFPMTQAGIHNLKNISEEFGCTIISCKPNIRAQKVLMRKFFEKYGKPTWYVDRLIYTFPLHMAAKFNTPMLCYGGRRRDRKRPVPDAGSLCRRAREAGPLLYELLCALEQLQELPDRQRARLP